MQSEPSAAATVSSGVRCLPVPDRHRRVLIADPDPAVLRVARLRVAAQLLADARQVVGLDGGTPRLDVHVEDARGVRSEDLVLDLVGELRVLEAVHQLIRHAQAAEAFNLALRAAAPDAVGPPED